MPLAIPILSAYDPVATGEGTIDPLGLYQIADQLATRLVPGVRERMQRIRFLTAMAVGSIVCADVKPNADEPDCPPFLVWEWLVVEAMVRKTTQTDVNDEGLWGLPGSLVTRRAVETTGYLDARGYLKTPRVFGFHAVYKRLAARLNVMDVHLHGCLEAERLVSAWVSDLGTASWEILRVTWRNAVQRSLNSRPCRTNPGWSSAQWCELADAFWLDAIKPAEKACLRELLLATDERRLGALPPIWALQEEFPRTDEDDAFTEEELHQRLRTAAPEQVPLLDAIAAYEAFARAVQDAFDVLRFQASGRSGDFQIADIVADERFLRSIEKLEQRCAAAGNTLAAFDTTMSALFTDRFVRFLDHRKPVDVAREICEHHEDIQQRKGKRAWFDRFGPDRIYLRQDYRIQQDEFQLQPGRYVHAYRGNPIRRFYFDLLADT